LDHPASIHLHGQINDLALHDARQDLLLDLVPMFKELLNDVVAKNIPHELKGVGLDLSEDLIFLVAIGRLQLLLDETRAMLVATELDNVLVDTLQLESFVWFRCGAEVIKKRASHAPRRILIFGWPDWRCVVNAILAHRQVISRAHGNMLSEVAREVIELRRVRLVVSIVLLRRKVGPRCLMMLVLELLCEAAALHLRTVSGITGGRSGPRVRHWLRCASVALRAAQPSLIGASRRGASVWDGASLLIAGRVRECILLVLGTVCLGRWPPGLGMWVELSLARTIAVRQACEAV
jgi:hypothetical protein